jgi:hypothetical protein
LAKAKLSEHDIQGQILGWLKLMGIFHWRNNTGAFAGEYKGKRRFVRYGVKGAPDIFVVHKSQIIGIEVKIPGKQATDDQIQFGSALYGAGGFYIVAHSLDDVLNFLRNCVNRGDEGGLPKSGLVFTERYPPGAKRT